jgi:hypothetical protein
MPNLKYAITNQYLCRFYDKHQRISFTPLSLEISQRNEQNIIIGVDENNERFCAFPLSDVQKMIVDESIHTNIDDNDYAYIQDFFKEYDNKELE